MFFLGKFRNFLDVGLKFEMGHGSTRRIPRTFSRAQKGAQKGGLLPTAYCLLPTAFCCKRSETDRRQAKGAWAAAFRGHAALLMHEVLFRFSSVEDGPDGLTRSASASSFFIFFFVRSPFCVSVFLACFCFLFFVFRFCLARLFYFFAS